MVLEKKAINAIEMTKNRKVSNNGSLIQSVDELAELLKVATSKSNHHSSSEKGNSKSEHFSSMPVPKNTICVGFTLPVTTSPRVQSIYMNVLNSVFLLRSSIRGVLFDKEGQFMRICQFNQFVCISDYE